MSLSYNPNSIFSNVIVIGAGGTGSRVIAQLAQLMPQVPWIKSASPSMYVFDDDIVEAKNLTRQLFAKSDVGKHKAAVVAQRYSKQYDIPITAICQRINDESGLIIPYKAAVMAEGYTQEEAIIRMMRPTIVVLAVDSMEARRNIISAIAQMYFPYNMVIIDPGNEDTFGQVSVFNPIMHPIHSDRLGYAANHMGWVNNIPDFHPHAYALNYIPMPVAHYLTAQDIKGTGSCADLDQTLALNSLMASACVSVAQSLMFCLPVTVRTAYYGLDLDNRSDKIGLKWLRGICQGTDASHISPALFDALKVEGITYQQFVDKLLFDECAYEGLKDHIKAPLTQGQIELLKNLIPLPCTNLELFTTQEQERLSREYAAATAAREQAIREHNERLAAEAAALAAPLPEVTAATPAPVGAVAAAPQEAIDHVLATGTPAPASMA
jgi:molybdopterin/thiamine biosynthesis adenylyltransferase